MKRFLSIILVVAMCLCMAHLLSSCKKEKASFGTETESFLNKNAQADDEQDALISDEDSLISTTSDVENDEQKETDKNSATSTTAPKQSKTNPTSSSKSKTTKKPPNDLKPTSQDFKTLSNILNWDGGGITYTDSVYFNYKTTSVKRFIEVANSSGFVPAYRAYVDKNMFENSDTRDIDNDGYEDISVSLKGFNWVLKKIYNYSGSEISSSNPCGCNVRGDKIYFWIPPDEGGVYGEFRFKNSSEQDGKYVIKFDYYSMIDPYVDNVQYEFDSVYTVTAAFKTVRNVDNTGDINVWSIYSIEKTENYRNVG